MTPQIIATMVCILVSIGVAVWMMQESPAGIQLSRMSTKTAYRNQGYRSHLDTGLVELSQCGVLHVSALYRHGSRFPSGKYIIKADALHQRLMQSKTASTSLPGALLSWTNRFSLTEAKDLTDVGRQELDQLGRRMAERWGWRLVGPHRSFTVDNSRFSSSDTQRSLESGRHFMRGLLASDSSDQLLEDSRLTRANSILRFFDTCPRFLHTVEDNKTAVRDYHTFRGGPEMTRVAEKVTRRFNLTDIGGISTEDVQLIFTLCGLEAANNISSAGDDSGLSPWCQLLTNQEGLVVEYLLDLKHYWRKAYGYNINYQQSCPMFSHVIDTMNEVVNSDQGLSKLPRGNFMFAHAETVLPVLAMLGLFNQSVVPQADNFDEVTGLGERQRTFLTSRITPFSANVALVVYSCASMDGSKKPSYRVQPLVNEHSVSWPLCGGRTHCSYKEFMDHVAHCHKDTFDHEKTCSFDGASSSTSSTTVTGAEEDI